MSWPWVASRQQRRQQRTDAAAAALNALNRRLAPTWPDAAGARATGHYRPVPSHRLLLKMSGKIWRSTSKSPKLVFFAQVQKRQTENVFLSIS